RAEAVAQLVEEARVDVDRLVGRAVERADRARGAPASGARLPREQLDLRAAVTALEGAGPVVVEEHRGTPPAAVEVRVGVGAGLALLERRVVAAGRTPAHAADEPREIRAAEQRDHERDDADDAGPASDRDAALGAAADAALADVGALVEGHVTTLVRRRARGEGSAALAMQDAAHAFPHRRGRW